MTDIHFIIGSTGAGKTTYARRLASEHRALPFSIDEWMQELFAPDLVGADFVAIGERVERARRQMWDVAGKAQPLGMACVFDTGLLTRASRDQARTEAARRGLSARFHYVAAPIETRWARVAARNAARDGAYAFEVTRPMFDFIETIWQAPDAVERAEPGFTMVGAEDA
ncbi:MAG: AAA family ATPase [Rhodoblastus sp.]|nr:AAA family ATPase [Rhodoblastus sp.]MCC2107400.1 AAA family ATPase [Hyphomicrobiales bacterium]